MDADVIVVGGGPGGASAAAFLKRKGFSVLLLEKSSLPRYKACAGCVPAGGLDLLPFSCEEIIEQAIDRATFACGSKRVTQPVPEGSLYMVRRDRFDWFLLQKSGAWIEPGCAVTAVEPAGDRVRVVCSDGRSYTAGHVIGADGASSRVAASLGLRRGKAVGAAVQFELKATPAVLEHFQGRLVVGFGVLDRGYYWIFPKKNHLSVGIGTMNKRGVSLVQTLQEAARQFDLSLDSGPRHAHPLPIHVRPEPLHQGRCLLVGDAAGLVDPLTGEGIRHAMESGWLAAEVIAKGNREDYSRLIDERIGRDLRRAYRLASFFYPRQGLCFHWLVRHRRIFRQMTRILASRSTYRQALTALPLIGLDFWNRRSLDA